MPTVPTYNERQVSSSPLPSNGFSAQSSPEHFGAGLAQAGDQYINAFAEAKQRANVALSQDALLQVQEYADDLFNNPNTGLYTKQGKNAVGQSDEIMASISAKGQELFMQLPEGSREDVVKQFNVVKRQYANQAKSYELKEIQSFETSRNNGAVAGYAKSASDNFNNPQAFISFMALGRHNIIEFNRSRGVSEEEISAKIAEFDNQVAWTAAQNAMATDAMGTIGAVGEPSDLGGVSRSSTYYGGNVGSVKGMTQQGNINLMNRPKVQNEDGSVSTVRTISVGTDEGEVLLPTVSDDGKLLTDDEAIALYEKTGKHLGIFDNPDDATAYAEQLHNQQEQLYVQGGGSRNNNPGNIRISDNNWEGQIGDDGEFVRFASPEHGVRALGKNLITYRNKGVVTINQIISRWAPKKDGNDTEGYIKFVSGKMGVDPNVPIDVTDINTLKSITTAIMQQEGNHSISGEQIDAGLQAALGLTRLPEPDPSQYQSRGQTGKAVNAGGNAWWPMLTPVQQYQIRKQGEAARKEQQRERKAITDDDFDNAIAAYERGEDAPNAPGLGRLVDANGEYEGQKKYAELQDAKRYSVLMTSAKDMSPDAQHDLVQRSKPDLNDPNYNLKIQRWDKFNKWVNGNIIEQEKTRAANEFNAARRNKFPLDPNNEYIKNAANTTFDREIFPSFSVKNADSLNKTAEFVSSTGIIPDRVGSYFSAASMSKEPSIVVPMAKVYGQVFDSNPAALANMDSKSGGYFKTIYDLTSAGVGENEAVEFAYSQVYEQSEEKKKHIRDITNTKDYSVKVDKLAQNAINSMSPSFYFGIPSTEDTGNPMWNYLVDYRTAYQANFISLGGNEDTAKAVTDMNIKKKWGVTELNGKEELMRYAPEAVYGINNSNAGNWVLSQWQEEKETLKPLVEGGMADGDDFILFSDAITARDSSYGIMVNRTSKEGVVKPELLKGANGMAMRFKPDQKSSSMYQELIAGNKANVVRANDKRSQNQDEKQRYETLANDVMAKNIPDYESVQQEVAERTAKNIEQNKADQKRRKEEAKQRRQRLNQQVEDARKNDPVFSSMEKTVEDMLKSKK
ncbi:hypothetical protein OSC03_02820 [Morganella morganii]|uniref:hypothetical protein n=1 Tax=Morganella morganii TaxID=582 RepID=UPI002876231D|nr:hypothetical protein [Morganella morganii]MDS0905944.1 hypothetical protein [Morganella morganii]